MNNVSVFFSAQNRPYKHRNGKIFKIYNRKKIEYHYEKREKHLLTEEFKRKMRQKKEHKENK